MFVGYKWQVNLNDIQTLHMQSSDIIFNAMSMPENTLVKIFNRSFLLKIVANLIQLVRTV